MSEHEKAPWKTYSVNLRGGHMLYPLNRRGAPPIGVINRHVNAVRILTCINACAGIPNDELENIKRYKQALEAAPDISNCNTLGYVEWYNEIRAEALKGE